MRTTGAKVFNESASENLTALATKRPSGGNVGNMRDRGPHCFHSAEERNSASSFCNFLVKLQEPMHSLPQPSSKDFITLSRLLMLLPFINSYKESNKAVTKDQTLLYCQKV